MNCPRAEELFSDYLEKRLAPPLERDVRRHLESCPECTSLFSAFCDVVSALPGLQPPPLPVDAPDRLLARMKPALAEASLRTDAAPPTGLPSFYWIAAAAVFLLVLLWKPPGIASEWSRRASLAAHQAYGFGVRTYYRAERLVEELDVLRMTVGVAFEDRIDRLNERLRELDEARRRRGDEAEQSNRVRDRNWPSRVANRTSPPAFSTVDLQPSTRGGASPTSLSRSLA